MKKGEKRERSGHISEKSRKNSIYLSSTLTTKLSLLLDSVTEMHYIVDRDVLQSTVELRTGIVSGLVEPQHHGHRN